MTYRQVHKLCDILNSEKSKHLTYKKYPSIQMNIIRFLQRSFFFRVRCPSLENDIEGLKKKEKMAAENF